MMSSEEIKDAMMHLKQVKYEGISYSRISAYIYRVIETNKPGVFKAILQCELLDRNKKSVVIVDPKKVELIEDGN